jgi:hypothetical protein
MNPSPRTCVYEAVYVTVFDRVSGLLAHPDDETARTELRALSANLEVLVGAARLAAGLGNLDAYAQRTARDRDDICRAACDSPCELHPGNRK